MKELRFMETQFNSMLSEIDAGLRVKKIRRKSGGIIANKLKRL